MHDVTALNLAATLQTEWLSYADKHEQQICRAAECYWYQWSALHYNKQQTENTWRLWLYHVKVKVKTNESDLQNSCFCLFVCYLKGGQADLDIEAGETLK